MSDTEVKEPKQRNYRCERCRGIYTTTQKYKSWEVHICPRCQKKSTEVAISVFKDILIEESKRQKEELQWISKTCQLSNPNPNARRGLLSCHQTIAYQLWKSDDIKANPNTTGQPLSRRGGAPHTKEMTILYCGVTFQTYILRTRNTKSSLQPNPKKSSKRYKWSTSIKKR